MLADRQELHLQHVECLLKYGADPNLKNSEGNAPLNRLFLRQNWKKMDDNERAEHIRLTIRFLKTLLAAGADINSRGQKNYTPLHHAILWHDAEILKVMLAAGAEPHAVDNNGYTPYDMLKPEDFPNFTPEFQHLLDTYFKPKP